MRAMEHHTSSTGLTGFLITFILWITGKILWLLQVPSIAQLASAATLISATIVAIMNAPKAYKVIKDILKRKTNQHDKN